MSSGRGVRLWAASRARKRLTEGRRQEQARALRTRGGVGVSKWPDSGMSSGVNLALLCRLRWTTMTHALASISPMAGPPAPAAPAA